MPKITDYRQIQTDRILLREWKDSDFEPFAEMGQDVEVMRYFPKHLTSAESKAMIERCAEMLAKDQFGYWAVEELASKEFIGFLALARFPYEAHFAPCTEIGWRLRKKSWGKGFATEGAKALLQYGFENLQLNEILALTAHLNVPSQKVMQRLGMLRNPADDFFHPKVAEDSPLRPHLVYRMKKP